MINFPEATIKCPWPLTFGFLMVLHRLSVANLLDFDDGLYQIVEDLGERYGRAL